MILHEPQRPERFTLPPVKKKPAQFRGNDEIRRLVPIMEQANVFFHDPNTIDKICDQLLAHWPNVLVKRRREAVSGEGPQGRNVL